MTWVSPSRDRATRIRLFGLLVELLGRGRELVRSLNQVVELLASLEQVVYCLREHLLRAVKVVLNPQDLVERRRILARNDLLLERRPTCIRVVPHLVLPPSHLRLRREVVQKLVEHRERHSRGVLLIRREGARQPVGADVRMDLVLRHALHLHRDPLPRSDALHDNFREGVQQLLRRGPLEEPERFEVAGLGEHHRLGCVAHVALDGNLKDLHLANSPARARALCYPGRRSALSLRQCRHTQVPRALSSKFRFPADRSA
mmetsp:Transcript_6835/g.14066  ORF Transcript_6835/g.14066 Transcript_6835/m.14066 type:complete len:259 (+) Transcript_6835:952-1728(+)